MTYILTSQIKEESWSVLQKITLLYYLRIALYHHIVIFLGQCIDTFKFYIIPSLLLIKENLNAKNHYSFEP